MKAIVLGGVAAGMSAASKLKREKPDTDVGSVRAGEFPLLRRMRPALLYRRFQHRPE